MKIKFNRNPEQLELLRLMGSKDTQVSREAMQIFADAAGPIIQKVIQQASTAGLIFIDDEFDEDTNPSYPLDMFYNEDAGYVTVWSQQLAGGLPSSTIEGIKEMKYTTYRLDSAVNFLKKYARQNRLPVAEKALNRMSQEMLVKMERNAWAVVLSAAAGGLTKNLQHVIRAGTAGSFLLDDLNKLITRTRRINSSWANGTPVGLDAKGLTDLFVSIEIKEQIRAFAYQPLNTKIGVVAGTSGAGYAAQGIPLPDNMRENIWKAAGMQEIFGVNITDLNELGVNQKYNVLFQALAGATTFKKADGTGAATFSSSAEELLLGIDASREAFIRPVELNENGGQFTVSPDDQFVQRSDKIGWYGHQTQGNICLDSRASVGLVV